MHKWYQFDTVHIFRLLVTEVAFAGEDHRDAVLVGSGNDFRVAHAATGLDDCFDARSGGGIEAIAEREERVAGADAACGTAR